MDERDKTILLDLQANCRTTYQSIARKLGISSNAVKKRVDKLLQDGVIVRFVTELSLEMFGGDVALCIIKTDGTEDEQEFSDTIGVNPMISIVGPTSGSQYMIFATHIGTKGLLDLGQFLRAQKSVTDVELVPLVFSRGQKVTYSKSHLKVLKSLIQDPRMPVADVSKQTGLASRTVRRLIKEIIEGQGVRFALSWDLNAGDGIILFAKIRWDETKTDLGILIQWLNDSFLDFYVPIITASEPVLFASFVVSDLKELDKIVLDLRKAPFVNSVIPYLGRPSRIYSDLKQHKLEELFTEGNL